MPTLCLFRDQNFALANVVGRRDEVFIFHLFDQARGFVIADAELALDIGGRAFAVFDHDGNGAVIERVFAVGVAAGGDRAALGYVAVGPGAETGDRPRTA